MSDFVSYCEEKIAGALTNENARKAGGVSDLRGGISILVCGARRFRTPTKIGVATSDSNPPIRKKA